MIEKIASLTPGMASQETSICGTPALPAEPAIPGGHGAKDGDVPQTNLTASSEINTMEIGDTSQKDAEGLDAGGLDSFNGARGKRDREVELRFSGSNDEGSIR